MREKNGNSEKREGWRKLQRYPRVWIDSEAANRRNSERDTIVFKMRPACFVEALTLAAFFDPEEELGFHS